MYSSLCYYTKESPFNSGNRDHKIDTITIHCTSGYKKAKWYADYFAMAGVEASSNYIVGDDGICGSVPEEKRSWASSNRANDERAVTIEVSGTEASVAAKTYQPSAKTYKYLIQLLVDICKRNGIKKLIWKNDKSLIGKPDKQNMTVHCWFYNKDCPGKWFMAHMGQIAQEVNDELSGTPEVTYRVRKSWEDKASQIGAYKILENAIKSCPAGYSVFDEAGKAVYSNVVDPLDNPSPWAREACGKAVEKGIFSGVGKDENGNTKFNWQDPLTREQMAVILDKLNML